MSGFLAYGVLPIRTLEMLKREVLSVKVSRPQRIAQNPKANFLDKRSSRTPSAAA
jgi:hypothetical protein